MINIQQEEGIDKHTAGRRFVIADIPQFQKNGEVPNRALTVGIPRTSWTLFTSGKFLKIKVEIWLANAVYGWGIKLVFYMCN